jgi:hypothetical protein
MSREQAARERRASERAQRERRNRPAALCSCAGTVVPPASREAGMRPAANAPGRRHNGVSRAGFGNGDGSMSGVRKCERPRVRPAADTTVYQHLNSAEEGAA